MVKDKKSGISDLRKRAVEILNERELIFKPQLSEVEALKLIHELEVHQIELELQNEELMLAKNQIEEASRKYAELFDFAPSGYFILSREGEIKEINLQGAKMLGKNRLSLIESRLGFFISEDTKPIFNQFLENIFKNKTKKSCEIRMVSADNRNMDILFHGILTDKTNQCLVIAVNITEIKKVEAALRNKEEKYRLLSDNAHDWVYWIAPDGHYRYISPSCFEMTGYTVEEFLNNPQLLQQIIHPKDRKTIEDHLLSEKKEHKFNYFEYRILTKSGETKWLSHSCGPIQNEEETYLGRRATNTDISKRKKTEQLLQKKNEELVQKNIELLVAKERAEESDRLKSAFLANMSHEIRTPMNGILGFADLLKESKLDEDEKQIYVNVIERSGMRMLHIINALIDISKIEAGQMEMNYSDTNINKQIKEIYSFFKPEAEQKGLQLKYTIPDQSESIMLNTDAEKLYAILTNLIKNAIKYTEQGAIEFGYQQKDKVFEFFVKDTGIGIPLNKHETIFDRFVQADNSLTSNYEGAGLGLAISKSYVEMLGGKIWVNSISGEEPGSSFYFTLPS